MKISNSHEHGHCGVHVRDLKCIYTDKYIGVSRESIKLQDVTIPIENVINCYEQKRHTNF